MFDYQPKLPELIFYPIFGGLIAWGISYNYPSPTTELFAAAMYINCAFVGSFYLYRESCKFVDSMNDTQPQAQQTAPVKTYLDMNKADERGNVFAQNTGGIRIDCIKKFNQTLIDQRNGNLVVDLSEGFWIKKIGDVEENRWTRIGGQGPTEFRTMLKRGEKFGAYKQTNGQGKWIVNPDGWKQVRRLANGEPLP